MQDALNTEGLDVVAENVDSLTKGAEKVIKYVRFYTNKFDRAIESKHPTESVEIRAKSKLIIDATHRAICEKVAAATFPANRPDFNLIEMEAKIKTNLKALHYGVGFVARVFPTIQISNSKIPQLIRQAESPRVDKIHLEYKIGRTQYTVAAMNMAWQFPFDDLEQEFNRQLDFIVNSVLPYAIKREIIPKSEWVSLIETARRVQSSCKEKMQEFKKGIAHQFSELDAGEFKGLKREDYIERLNEKLAGVKFGEFGCEIFSELLKVSTA